MQKAIFFDLDGTLTDSGEGIINCATLALAHFGLPVPSREEMRVFVGPPLDKTFIEFGVPADRVSEAIQVFRSRYVPVGIFENYPYPGIRELLEQLKEKGIRLFVATSKPEEMAHKVLNHFGLAHHFEMICGATFDGRISEKHEVIAELLRLAGEPDKDEIVMIGDRKYDIEGAHAFGIRAVGVTYGFGTREELETAGADAICESVEGLAEAIEGLQTA